jgi:hypothetical protein
MSSLALASMKLTTTTNVSVDGVMQGLGARIRPCGPHPSRDRRAAAPQGPGWEERDDAMHDGQILTHVGIQVTGRSSRGSRRSLA